MINLLGLDRTALINWCVEQGEPKFRATQLLKHIHQHGITDFSAMTDISKALRARLPEIATITPMTVKSHHLSPDGTRKWLFDIPNAGAIEAVYIPETTRATLCVSSQAGCALTCTFCCTGKQGFARNLSSAEIIGQLWHAVHTLRSEDPTRTHPITNIVFMGMGEPLLNLDAVISAIHIMRDDDAYGLSKRRVTVSTSGVVPNMYTLFEATDAALAVSLHAPNDTLRSELVPINRKYPLTELLAACKTYLDKDERRHVTIEYVMLQGVNDSLAHAKELVALLNGLRVKVNLIPFNPFVGTEYTRSTDAQITQFMQYLQRKDVFCFVRKTRGDAIAGACGQLAGQVQDKTSRQAKFYGRKNISGSLLPS